LISGIKIRHFLFLALCGLLIFLAAWAFVLKDYQKQRIITFINPQIDPKGISWSVNQAKIAIGSGGLFGKGLGRGPQAQYGFLPEPQTDFIFAAIAEEFGLVGIGILLALFSLLIWRITKIAILATSNFPRLFATGLAILLTFQIFIHIGMNLGILPIIGIPLPLISYGGSSLIATFIGLGVLQGIKAKK
jgi:rod shape determining protein RodA